MKVNISVANQRLFVGNIPKSKTRDEIFEEFAKIASGLIDVIIYASPDDLKKKNRGFAFLEYDTHKSGLHSFQNESITVRTAQKCPGLMSLKKLNYLINN